MAKIWPVGSGLPPLGTETVVVPSDIYGRVRAASRPNRGRCDVVCTGDRTVGDLRANVARRYLGYARLRTSTDWSLRAKARW
jgi:hypothetical protein